MDKDERYQQKRREMIQQWRDQQRDRDRARAIEDQRKRMEIANKEAEQERREIYALSREFDKAINIQARAQAKQQEKPKAVGDVRKPKPKSYAGRVSDAMDPKKSWLGD